MIDIAAVILSMRSLNPCPSLTSYRTKRKEPLKRNSVEASDRTSPTGTASDNQRTKIQETKEQSATEKKTTQAPAPEPKRVKTKAEEELERIQQMKVRAKDWRFQAVLVLLMAYTFLRRNAMPLLDWGWSAHSSSTKLTPTPLSSLRNSRRSVQPKLTVSLWRSTTRPSQHYQNITIFPRSALVNWHVAGTGSSAYKPCTVASLTHNTQMKRVKVECMSLG